MGGHEAKTGYADGMRALRKLGQGDKNLTIARQMSNPRWYPTATTLADGKVRGLRAGCHLHELAGLSTRSAAALVVCEPRAACQAQHAAVKGNRRQQLHRQARLPRAPCQVLVMGGTMSPGSGTKNNPTYELWDPASNNLTSVNLHPSYVRAAKDIYYPFNYLMPSGDFFTFCDFTGIIMDAYNGSVKAWLPPLPRAASGLRTEYPNTATGVLLPLRSRDNYSVETMSFGGPRALLAWLCWGWPGLLRSRNAWGWAGCCESARRHSVPAGSSSS